MDKTGDEIVEMQELEKIVGDCYIHDSTPDIGLRRLAMLEGNRVNLSNDGYDELFEESYDNINQHFIELVENSWINIKSLRLITNQKQEVGKDVFKSWSFYNVFPTNAPLISWEKWLSRDRKQKLSGKELERSRQEWLSYHENRKLNPSSCHKAILRMIDLATSPIYDALSHKDKQHKLSHGIYLKETDKTLVFYFPFREFKDFAANTPFSQYLRYVKAAFMLPGSAHEKTWYFSKQGAHYHNFIKYLENQRILLAGPLSSDVKTLSSRGELGFYRECFPQQKDRDAIRAYFLSSRSSHAMETLEKLRQEIRGQSSLIGVNHVFPQCYWYPEWMRQVGGIVVQSESQRESVIVKSSHDYLYQEIAKGVFAPSETLRKSSSGMTKKQFYSRYLDEMRTRYRANKKTFTEGASLYSSQQPIVGHSFPHNYPRVLDYIFRKIQEKNNDPKK